MNPEEYSNQVVGIGFLCADRVSTEVVKVISIVEIAMWFSPVVMTISLMTGALILFV